MAYKARAELSNNRIYANLTGVTSTVADDINGLGFVGTTQPNQIYANATGVQLIAATMQNQHVYGNITGVSGSGVLVASDLDHANLIEKQRRGRGLCRPDRVQPHCGKRGGDQGPQQPTRGPQLPLPQHADRFERPRPDRRAHL